MGWGTLLASIILNLSFCASYCMCHTLHTTYCLTDILHTLAHRLRISEVSAVSTRAVAEDSIIAESLEEITQRNDLRNLAIVAHVGEANYHNRCSIYPRAKKILSPCNAVTLVSSCNILTVHPTKMRNSRKISVPCFCYSYPSITN